MIRPVAAALGLAAGLLSGSGGAGAASAQGVTVQVPFGGVLPTVTPPFTIASDGFTAAQRPVVLRLLIGTDPALANTIVDTAVFGDTAIVIVPRPLPDGVPLFWRATARGSDGTTVSSPIEGPRSVRPWLVLLSPNSPTGSTLSSARPRFVWASADVDIPPGPWTYTFDLFRSNEPFPVFTASTLVDTTFTPGFDLDFNTSYRWRVTARLASGDSTRVASAASFVILDPGRPVATLLYQNFPNPFPRGGLASTCIWFDLRDPADVRLEIFDIRGNFVRRLVPSPELPAAFPAGRYGRAVGSTDGGCDPRFAWDGVADDGRVAAPGVYLLRLTADSQVLTKRILFRGR
jgi:hypothetical protein